MIASTNAIMRRFSFSVVIESANLSVADLEGVIHTLESISRDPLINSANEILLVDSGDIPDQFLVELTRRFPWLKPVRVDQGTGYEELKMIGAQRSTGDVVVMADGDCIYGSNWLTKILEPFEDNRVGVVGGYTEIASDTIYGLGVNLAFSFDPVRVAVGVHLSDRYQMNNVAFRKQVLRQVPLPKGLPCYRTTGIHCARLNAAGIEITRQPEAKSVHAPPNGIRHFVWRFLLFGHDAVIVPRLIRADLDGEALKSSRSRTVPRLFFRWLGQCFLKVWRELKAGPRQAVRVLPALVVLAFAMTLQGIGSVIGIGASRKLLSAMPEELKSSSTTSIT